MVDGPDRIQRSVLPIPDEARVDLTTYDARDRETAFSLPFSEGRLGQRLPHPLAKDNPSEKARQIVHTMAESLVQHLAARGLPAQRLRDVAGNLPREGWLVQGVFKIGLAVQGMPVHPRPPLVRSGTCS